LVEYLGSFQHRIHQLHIGIIWFLPSLFESLLFLPLVLLFWLGIQ
jgi:hypothetical protein